MTDLEEIRSRYALLTEAELLELLSDPSSLRPDAFEALKEECNRRGLDKSIVSRAEDLLPVAEPANIRGSNTRELKRWWREVKAYAFDQKYNNATDDEILAGLIGMRARNEEALYVIDKLEEWAGEALENAMADKISGITRTVCGLAVIIIIMLVPLGNTITILGGLLCIGGLIQVANAAYRRQRYMVIEENIRSQKLQVLEWGDEPFEYTEIV